MLSLVFAIFRRSFAMPRILVVAQRCERRLSKEKINEAQRDYDERKT